LQIYLVGGAVRDELLGKSVDERDWVVVGATPSDMLKQHFQPVGKDFPVFLHPATHEEYALARTERKTAQGYKGFQFYADKDVTLEEDLQRRDLTINAMAKSNDGKIIDPYHGQADLKARLFRHVSSAFSEDPVRILRVARFAAMLPDFTVHPETNVLMKQMVTSGEVNALVAERVWKEWSRALQAKAPARFFEVLAACNALAVLFPEWCEHELPSDIIQHATQKTNDPMIRFSVAVSRLSKAAVQAMSKRYRVPTEFSALALMTVNYAKDYHVCDQNDAQQLWELLKKVDAFRRPERLSQWIIACDLAYPKNLSKEKTLLQALAAAKSVDTKLLLEKNYQGKAFADKLKETQIQMIKTNLSAR